MLCPDQSGGQHRLCEPLLGSEPVLLSRRWRVLVVTVLGSRLELDEWWVLSSPGLLLWACGRLDPMTSVRPPSGFSCSRNGVPQPGVTLGAGCFLQ